MWAPTSIPMALRWKPFGRYFVSEAAHVWTGKMKVPETTRKGYLRYHLYDRGKRTKWYAHQLVMFLFSDDPRVGALVRHLDGDPLNNLFANLDYGSAKQNAEDRDRHGRTARGAKVATAQLCREKVQLIDKLYDAGGNTFTDIGNLFGVQPSTIRRAYHRQTWGHVPKEN